MCHFNIFPTIVGFYIWSMEETTKKKNYKNMHKNETIFM